MLEELIKDSIKSKKVIFGYRNSLKFVKMNEPKLIVIAKNIPDGIKKSIEQHAKIHKTKIEVFNGNSKELGALCGKPFSISIIVIKE